MDPKFIVKYSQEYEACLAYKAINMFRGRKNPIKAYFYKQKYFFPHPRLKPLSRFCVSFVHSEECEKYKCPFLHDYIEQGYYFFEKRVNAGYFEEKMSTNIIAGNILEIREKLVNKEDNSFLFPTVKELLDKINSSIEKGGLAGKGYTEKDRSETGDGSEVEFGKVDASEECSQPTQGKFSKGAGNLAGCGRDEIDCRKQSGSMGEVEGRCEDFGGESTPELDEFEC
jgi:hypothetical protein